MNFIDKIHYISSKSINEKVQYGHDWHPSPEKFPKFQKYQGTFVTLYKKSVLRGCIGVPSPVYKLGYSIAYSARNAAVKDPRFPVLDKNELEDINYSVEILTELTKMQYNNFSDLQNQIKLGTDGLMIERVSQRGLFLPKVPIEQNWDLEQYLEYLCRKGMIAPSFLYDKKTELYKFQSQIHKFSSILKIEN